ncbi:MAG: histidinol dehydrogenase [Candidatus Peribacteraceae bacterium]|nr:histidinol dehydrogenase [Candidatus Peribacteraceae bacterium]
MKTLSLSRDGLPEILRSMTRPVADLSACREKVTGIIDAVRREGDQAVKRYTAAFDGVALASLRVPVAEIRRAGASIDRQLRESMRGAARNIRKFQRWTMDSKDGCCIVRKGVYCWQLKRPIDAVGLYIPAGSAPLLSTVLMLTIPAQLAGVKRIVVCTPPGKDGAVALSTLAACAFLGVNEVYRIGGAQAIAAMAYGTETVPKVEKVAGPGNMFVTAAKALVAADPQGAAIDMLAGPSELLVIADASANPRCIAADLLSQAEHDAQSQVVLISTSSKLIAAVQRELDAQKQSLPRLSIVERSLERSCIVEVSSLDEAAQLSNRYAPEHLSLQVDDPSGLLPLITSAGSVFLGANAPVTVGDYCSGTNHVLPTSGCARTQSGVTVATFQKTIMVQSLTREGLNLLKNTATALARTEGLEAHARAVDCRFPPVP